jgi:hypothetical protein
MLHYHGPRGPQSASNLISVKSNVKVAWDLIMKEVEYGRIAGPFSMPPFPDLRISPIGLVPKKDGTFRMIQHLSYPSGSSINEFIDPALCSVHYATFDKAVDLVSGLGRGAFMGKMDIKSAFRLLTLAASEYSLLGIKLQDQYFYDMCLPQGCSISCATFEKFATFLEWQLLSVSQAKNAMHYLDDFFFGGKVGTNECDKLMDNFDNLCKDFGVPVAQEKTVGPVQIIVFLGLEIDSIEMVVRIPLSKLQELKKIIEEAMPKKKITLKALQSITGLLNFCLRAIPPGRAFCRRFYEAMSVASKPHHFIRVNRGMREDFKMWLMFLDCFNGSCIFPKLFWSSNFDIHLYTDAAGNPDLGCAAFLKPRWIYFQWPESWIPSGVFKDLTFLELVPIILAFITWGEEFKGQKVLLYTDNLSLVSVLNKCSSKSARVMQLVRPLVLHKMLINTQFKAKHILGCNNSIADALSRKDFVRFQRLVPDALPKPDPIPEAFKSLISGLNLSDC